MPHRTTGLEQREVAHLAAGQGSGFRVQGVSAFRGVMGRDIRCRLQPYGRMRSAGYGFSEF